MCTFLNFKFIKLKASQFKIILKTKIASMQNYQKLQIVSAFFHIYKFAHAKFACFHTCYQPMTNFTSFQVCKINFFYRLQINNYNFTISQIASACLQVHKYANLQVYKFAKLKKLQITN